MRKSFIEKQKAQNKIQINLIDKLFEIVLSIGLIAIGLCLVIVIITIVIGVIWLMLFLIFNK